MRWHRGMFLWRTVKDKPVKNPSRTRNRSHTAHMQQVYRVDIFQQNKAFFTPLFPTFVINYAKY